MLRHSSELDSDSEQKQHGHAFHPQHNKSISKSSIITQECELFLLQCFRYDVKERPFVEQLLAHEFITKYIDNAMSDSHSKIKTSVFHESEFKDLNFNPQIKKVSKKIIHTPGSTVEIGFQIKKMASNASKIDMESRKNENASKCSMSPQKYLKKESINSMPGESMTIIKRQVVSNIGKIKLPKLRLSKISSELEGLEVIEGYKNTPALGNNLVKELEDEQQRLMAELLGGPLPVKDSLDNQKGLVNEESPVIDRRIYGKEAPQPNYPHTEKTEEDIQNSSIGSLNPSRSFSPTESHRENNPKKFELKISPSPLQTELGESVIIDDLEAEQARLMRELMGDPEPEPQTIDNAKIADNLPVDIDTLEDMQRKLMEDLLGDVNDKDGEHRHADRESNNDNIDNLEDMQRKLMEELMMDVVERPSKGSKGYENEQIIQVKSKTPVLESAVAAELISENENSQKSEQMYFKIAKTGSNSKPRISIDMPQFALGNKGEGIFRPHSNHLDTNSNLKLQQIGSAYTFKNERAPLHEDGLSEDSSISNEKNPQSLKKKTPEIKIPQFGINPIVDDSQSPNDSQVYNDLFDPCKSNQETYNQFSEKDPSDDDLDISKTPSAHPSPNPRPALTTKPLLKKPLYHQSHMPQLPLHSPSSLGMQADVSPSISPLPNHATGLTPTYRDKFAIKVKKLKNEFVGELYSSSDSSNNDND